MNRKVCPFCLCSDLKEIGPNDPKCPTRKIECQNCLAEAYIDFWDKRPMEDKLREKLKELRKKRKSRKTVV